MGRAMYGIPVIRCHTSGPQPAACTRTSTSFSPTTGASISLNSRTSAVPYRSCMIAFISSPLSVDVRRTLARPDRPRSYVARTSRIDRAATGLPNPFSANSPAGFASTTPSTSAKTRSVTRIWPGWASSQSLDAMFMTLPTAP